jgi:hypothetical protein
LRRTIKPMLPNKPRGVPCNQRQLEFARERADEIALVALSDGTADGAGGTQDMIERARDAGGQVDVIDAKRLLARSANTDR